MKKKDLPLIIAIFALLWAWPHICLWLFPPVQGPQPAEGEQPAEATTAAVSSNAAAPAGQTEAVTAPAATDSAAPQAVTPPPAPAAVAASNEAACHASAEPRLVELTNDVLSMEVSSWGAGVVSAALKEYRLLNKQDSPPMKLVFEPLPALSYSGIPGLSTNHDFEVAVSGDTVVLSRQTDWGLRFERRMRFTNGYLVGVWDTFSNASPGDIAIPAHSMRMGPMQKTASERSGKNSIGYLGIDSQAASASERVRHWERDRTLSRSFGRTSGFGCISGPPSARFPVEHAIVTNSPTDWMAVKNKFFTQIVNLTEDEPSGGITLHATRFVSASEEADPGNPATWPKNAVIVQVAASMDYPGRVVPAGQSFTRHFTYYVGPKKYSVLRPIGRDDVMEFGFWAFMCRILLPTLTWIHDHVAPNYGVSIIIITLLIRIIFWPIMTKSTESMKKMQELQPRLKELKEKYGNDQQKFIKKQQELFKENKVNPLGGCLPMLIQIPVFIALYTVLRSAVELRFAGFLWIADLSEAENLLVDTLGVPINILPILMTATMVWQQRLTPSGGDPQQQKIMAVMMPVMFFFMFYPMPSGLVLYWTTSQTLSIIQLLVKDWTDAKKKAAAPNGGKG